MSDAEGRFVVERIPGDSRGVCQRYVANSNDKGGRPIAGLITRIPDTTCEDFNVAPCKPGTHADRQARSRDGFPHKLDWNKVVSYSPSDLRTWGMIRDGGTYGESWTAFLQTEEGKSYVRANIVPAVDGTIQVEGLPPAEYDLTVTVTGRA